jgi:hypothetical protein
MPILDTFIRSGGETSPFNLVNHVPTAGGAWAIRSGNNFVVSPDGFARLNVGNAVSLTEWTGEVGADNYEVAVEGSFRSNTANATLAACTRVGSSAGILHRVYISGTTLVVNIQDAFTPFTSQASISNVLLTLNNPYLIVGTANGSTFTTSVKNLATNLWLTSAGTFSSATRVAAVTATVAHSSARGRAGIQDFAAATDTTGSAYDSVSYGAPGTLGQSGPTAVTLTGPTSGTVGQASAPFTASTDNPITSGSVIVTPSDGGNGGTFSPTTVTLTSTTSTGQFTYTAASQGTKTISVANNGGLSNPASISYAASDPTPVTNYSFTGPSSCIVGQQSTNYTVTLGTGVLTGTVTITPSDGGGGGTFNPANVSLTDSVRSATFAYTANSAGAKTISVTNNGGLTNPSSIITTATVDQTVYPDNANIIKSPTNWHLSGTVGLQRAETVYPGSYFRLRFNGTAISVGIDTTGLSAYPWVFTQIDANNPSVAKLTAGQTFISITGLTAGDHELLLIYDAKDNYNQANTWSDAQKLVITSFTPSGGTGLLPAVARSKKAIIYGDSITAGLAVTSPPGISTAVGTNSALASYANHIGVALGAEFDQCGCGGDGWTVGGVGGFPSFPNAWNFKKSGVSRSLASHDYIVVIHGYNDGANDISSSIISNWLTAVRATTQAWIFLCVPFSGRQRGSITTGAANYIAANPSETKVKVIDLGSTSYQAVQSGYYTTDGVHPNPWQNGRLAAAYLREIIPHISGTVTQAPQYRGGFRPL